MTKPTLRCHYQRERVSDSCVYFIENKTNQKMDPVRETKIKNNVWRKMSKGLNRKSISRLAAAFRQACLRVFVCGQTEADDKVTRCYNGDISASFNIGINNDQENGRGYRRLLVLVMRIGSGFRNGGRNVRKRRRMR